jgi:hypothetical protein
MESQLLFVCKDAAGGCGHVGPRKSWIQLEDTIEMCPVCLRDHAFAVDLENVHRLQEWGMDPEPVRKLLKIEEAKEIDETHDAIDNYRRQNKAGYRPRRGGGHDYEF